MWHLKTTTVPVIVGALGMIKKGADKYINKIPGSPGLYEIKRSALCGLARLFRIVLSNVIEKRGNKKNKFLKCI